MYLLSSLICKPLGLELGQQVRRHPWAAQLSRLRGQRHDGQEPEADRHAQEFDQISGELCRVQAVLNLFLRRRLAASKLNKNTLLQRWLQITQKITKSLCQFLLRCKTSFHHQRWMNPNNIFEFVLTISKLFYLRTGSFKRFNHRL